MLERRESIKLEEEEKEKEREEENTEVKELK